MNLSIVAMSGGERTKAFNSALELTGDEHPDALIVPTACSTPASYDRKVSITLQRFTDLGVSTRLLHEYGDFPSKERLRHELSQAALIYTIGGNTPYLLDKFDSYNARGAFIDAIVGGTTHAGTSAGALLPFELAHSNVAKRPAEEEWDYAFLPTLGLVQGVATVHANTYDQTPTGPRQDNRLQALAAHFPADTNRGFAIDNGASLIINGGVIRSLRETPGSQVHVLEKTDSDELTISQLD